MTPPKAISALAISPILATSLALGVQGQTPTIEAGEKAAPIIACTLTSKEMGARVARVENELLKEVLRSEELENGYALWFPVAPGRLQRLAEFVELESQCCAFLDFEIRLGAGAHEVALVLTGPEGTKEVLRALMEDS